MSADKRRLLSQVWYRHLGRDHRLPADLRVMTCAQCLDLVSRDRSTLQPHQLDIVSVYGGHLPDRRTPGHYRPYCAPCLCAVLDLPGEAVQILDGEVEPNE